MQVYMYIFVCTIDTYTILEKIKQKIVLTKIQKYDIKKMNLRVFDYY